MPEHEPRPEPSGRPTPERAELVRQIERVLADRLEAAETGALNETALATELAETISQRHGPGSPDRPLAPTAEETAPDDEDTDALVDGPDSNLEDFPGLAEIMSHDLRNPLSVLRTHTDLAREDLGQDRYETMIDNIERMDEIIDHVRALSKQADVDQDLEIVQLEAVARDAWDSVETADATLLTGQWTLEGDRAQLRQLFENLFRNSVDHADDDPTVRVGPLDDGRGFYVEDDGPGIPAAERERVFDHGYTTASEGTGFGLAIVHKIVENHCWAIDVTESPEGGARFEIYLEGR